MFETFIGHLIVMASAIFWIGLLIVALLSALDDGS